MMVAKRISGQITESVSPNGHFPNPPFTETDYALFRQHFQKGEGLTSV